MKIKIGFITKMMILVMMPMIILASILTVVTIKSQMRITNQLLEEQLDSVAYNIIENFDTINDDKYIMEDNILKKGDYTISDNTDYVDKLKEDTGLYATVFYKDTRILTSIKDENGNRVIGTKADAEVSEKVLNKGEEYYTNNIRISDVDCCASYIPLKQAGSNEVIGMIFVGKNKADVDKERTSAIAKSIIWSIGILFVFIGIVYIFVVKIVSAIKNAKNQIDEVSKGNIIERHIEKFEERNDEIGDILRASKKLVNSLRKTVLSIVNVSSELKAFSDEYNKSFDNVTESIKNINVAIGEIANSATLQAHESQSANDQVINMGSVIDDTTNSVQSLFTSSEKMSKCNKRVTNTISDLEQISRKTKESVDIVNEQTNVTNDSANEIRIATDLISEIANQTNLLSLNASIEAARAGEAGKGFAIVAEQIGILAEQSQNSADKITKIVENLIANSNTSVSTMHNVETIINEQNDKLNVAKDVFKQLNDEVNAVSYEINRMVKQIDNLTEIKNKVLNNVESLAATAQENAASTEETSATMEGVNEIINECAESAKELLKLSQELNESSSNFKLE